MAGCHARPFHRPYPEGWAVSCLLVLGGARSGKSRHAEQLASGEKCYIATAEAVDGEMRQRIEHHKVQRGSGWTTVEAPLDLAGALQQIDEKTRFILIDCLTVWIGNLMHHGKDVVEEVERLATTIEAAKGRVVVVSNEVGQGIVPENAMARRFRDLQGLCNQRIAAVADEVVLVVAGIPMTIKKAKRPAGKKQKAASGLRRKA
jgi:adenosylcobinamide kinase / adenosylcobinamide-phosphate guanylyltransferase